MINRKKHQILERKNRNYLQIRYIWKSQVHKTSNFYKHNNQLEKWKEKKSFLQG